MVASDLYQGLISSPCHTIHRKEGQYFGLADTSSFDLSTVVSMELEKGEFVVFTDHVLHHAGPNRLD